MPVLTRRRFATSLVGAVAAASLPRAARAAEPPALVARPATWQLAPEGYPATGIWGFDGRLPGPEIRVRQGERIARRFVNALPEPSTVHWHGIRIDNAMDGVPGVTQAPVAAGEAFLYDFVLPDAGTYWYHPHSRSYEQVGRGLYGALVVEERAGAPEVDGEEVLLIDDWRLTPEAQIAGEFGALHDIAHGGRIGNWVTVSGEGDWRRPAERHARLRLRLVNTANARIFALGLQGLQGWVMALDGMPLARPQPAARLVLAPAQRADLVVDVLAGPGEEAFVVSHEREGGFALATLAVDGETRAQRLPEPLPLPANPVPALGSLESARRVRLRMEGGAMGGMRGALLAGREADIRALTAAGRAWALNGAADMPRAPLVEVERGETLRIEMINDTAWPHAMHLHGHHFRPLGADAAPGPLRDTLLMARGETAEIALVADNPGDWLLHCHMLEHSAGGMMTWVRVS